MGQGIARTRSSFFVNGVARQVPPHSSIPTKTIPVIDGSVITHQVPDRHSSISDYIDDFDVADGLEDGYDVGCKDEVSAPGNDCICCRLPLGSCRNYIRETVEIIYQINKSGSPNRDLLKIRNTVTIMFAESWGEKLRGYYDQEDIVQSILFG